MSDADKVTTNVPRPPLFSTPREIVELLIEKHDIHAGHWALAVQFGFAALNSGPSESEVFPTALAAVTHVGIFEVPNAIPHSVDAAKVNPTSEASSTRTPPTGQASSDT